MPAMKMSYHKQLVVELANVSFGNKGDCLMALAVQKNLPLVVENVAFATRARVSAQTLRRHGLMRLAQLPIGYQRDPRAGIKTIVNRVAASKLAQPVVERAFGMVPFGRVDVLLDVCGFSYSDHWGEARMRRDRDLFLKAKRDGKQIVLLPRTYGPFEGERMRALARETIGLADLVFVRDKRSYNFLLELGFAADELHLFPDYTGGLTPVADPKYDHLAGGVCVIPNYRVVDKLRGNPLSEYVAFLKQSLELLLEADAKPFVLVHAESGDPEIASELSSLPVPIVWEDDPLKLKGIVGRSRLVLSSRLHGLINGLSQNVPSIAVGWSHKYGELMADYGVPEYSVEWASVSSDVPAALDKLMRSDAEYQRVKTVLAERQNAINASNTAMWTMIGEFLSRA